MRSTSVNSQVKSFVITLTLLSTLTLSATARPATPPKEVLVPKDEPAIVRFQKSVKKFFTKALEGGLPDYSITIPKP